MKLKGSVPFLCVLLLVFLPACREDPEVVKQHERQNAELSRLRSGISIIEAGIKDLPADLSSELKEAGKIHEDQNAGIQELKTAISDTSAQMKSVQEDMKAYRIKYPIQ